MDETDILRQKLFELYHYHKAEGTDLGTLTVWDLFLELIPDPEVRSMAVLKADLPILELLARGRSEQDVARTLGVSIVSVKTVAELWNIRVPLKTLDTDPLLLYNADMSFEQFYEEFREWSFTNYDRRAIANAYDTVLTYKGLSEFIKELEDEVG